MRPFQKLFLLMLMSKDFRLTEFRILIEMNEKKFNLSTKYPTRNFLSINKTYFSSLMKKK